MRLALTVHHFIDARETLLGVTPPLILERAVHVW